MIRLFFALAAAIGAMPALSQASDVRLPRNAMYVVQDVTNALSGAPSRCAADMREVERRLSENLKSFGIERSESMKADATAQLVVRLDDVPVPATLPAACFIRLEFRLWYVGKVPHPWGGESISTVEVCGTSSARAVKPPSEIAGSVSAGVRALVSECIANVMRR